MVVKKKKLQKKNKFSMTLQMKLALCYRVPRITAFVDEDLKLIKKIPLILQKLEKYGKNISMLEAFNILKALDNVFDMSKLFLVICEVTPIEYHSTIGYLVEELAIIDSNSNMRIIKKLQDLVVEED